MNLRQLRKQDKRAAAILLALHRHRVTPQGFGRNDDGRYSYSWRCSYEYDEWDDSPALDFLQGLEGDDFMCECIDMKTGAFLPDDMWPPHQPSAMRKLPAGWRWRGRRVVRVDKDGGMVSKHKQGGA